MDGKPTNYRWNRDHLTLPYCEYSAVEVNRVYAFMIFFLNIILPGFGTFVSAFSDRKGFNFYAVWIAFLQFVSTIVFAFGWFWSVKHGYITFRQNIYTK